MKGDIPDGREPQEREHITLEGADVAAPAFGEADIDLMGGRAFGAEDALDGQFDAHRLRADGQRVEVSDDGVPALRASFDLR